MSRQSSAEGSQDPIFKSRRNTLPLSLSPHAVKAHPLGFFQLDPVPDAGILSEFYESRYYDLLREGGRAPELRRLLDAGGERAEELAWLEATLYQDLGDAIARYVGDREVLDVGCGAGDLVVWLAGRGWRASGIDPSRDAVSAATARGVNAHCATLESWADAPGNADRYGAITLVNVLEHVPDPIAVLTALRGLLAPGGALSFRVPNDFTAIQAAAEGSGVQRQGWWVTAPDHINYFRAESARAACAAAGLTVVDVTADFPMEFFLLMGVNYVDDPACGKQAHGMRRRFEMTMPKDMRQSLYRALADVGMGRNILVTAVRP
jgi:2-polyprenyl-3-methyl-5-hydroxy-6-metoxy-1,4-benzoquinol methylase